MHHLIYAAFAAIHGFLFYHAWGKLEEKVVWERYRQLSLEQRCNLVIAGLYSASALVG